MLIQLFTRPVDPPLVTLPQEGLTVREIEEILKDTSYTGYPVVISQESQHLLGYIIRKDLMMALGKKLKQIK